LWLGHAGIHTVKDSLGGFLRRRAGLALTHMVAQIRAGKATTELFREARRAIQNPFSATEDVLLTATLAAKQAKGPILEIGSGLSTIALAAATDQTVWCVEHDEVWAARTKQMAVEAGTHNIAIWTAPIKGGWYDTSVMDDAPAKFSLALNDGPPRSLASRMPFFAYFGDRADTIVADDADDSGYRSAIEKWCAQHGRKLTMVGRAAYIERM
jgi:predicted O-methyltransferase YrrM